MIKTLQTTGRSLKGDLDECISVTCAEEYICKIVKWWLSISNPWLLSSLDVDECSFEEQCRRELGNVCVNTPGSFVCQCQQGFRAEAPACVGKSVIKLCHSWVRLMSKFDLVFRVFLFISSCLAVNNLCWQEGRLCTLICCFASGLLCFGFASSPLFHLSFND